MAAQVGNATSIFRIPYDNLSDERTRNWLLVPSLSSVIAWIAVYLLMVWRLPKWMARRQQLEMRPILVVYNLAMACLNFHIAKELLTAAIQLKYDFFCQPCRVIYSKYELQIAAAIWWFYFSKLLEFMDTLFFILRKKSTQLTFLHVYHHSTMFPLWWIAVRWVPTGSSFIPATLNSCVHVIMYTYYGLSAIGPSMRNYLWWKKYLTALQLIQFIFCLLWSAQALLRGCKFPAWINWSTMIYMIVFLILFGRFYARSYRTKGGTNKKHQ